MTTSTLPDPPRFLAVDTMRLLAILAVIIIHACPFRNLMLEHDAQQYSLLGTFLNQLARFAVPFFFTISGFFWGVKVRRGMPVVSISAQTAKRLLYVLAAGSVLYAIPYNLGAIFEYGAFGPVNVWYWHIRELAADPQRVLFEGTHDHLWFLVALLWAVVISTVFVHIRQTRYLMGISIALYVFGVLALAYAKTPIGIEFDFNTREGPFFSTLLFVIGYVISGYSPEAKWLRLGTLLTLVGFAIHFSEVYFLWKWWHIPPFHHYVFGTVLIGLGVSLVALSAPSFLCIEALAKIGRFALGIYVIHYVFVDWLVPINSVVKNPFWEIGRVFLIFILALFVAQGLSKYKIFKKLVT